jgi:hypothetical protein
MYVRGYLQGSENGRVVTIGVLAAILKFWKCRIAPEIVTYHCVKIYVSIINHLEVINIIIQ